MSEKEREKEPETETLGTTDTETTEEEEPKTVHRVLPATYLTRLEEVHAACGDLSRLSSDVAKEGMSLAAKLRSQQMTENESVLYGQLSAALQATVQNVVSLTSLQLALVILHPAGEKMHDADAAKFAAAKESKQ